MIENKNYSYDEVYNATLKYFNNDELATTTWIKKYCLKDENKNLCELTPDDSHRRYAKEFARIEFNYFQKIDKTKYELLSDTGKKRFDKLKNATLEELEEHFYFYLKGYRYIIPGGSIMENLGTNSPTSISNCFVVDAVEDSIEDILISVMEMGQVGKRRGGCVEENSKILVKDKGIIPIKDVNIGDMVLSFNINAKIDEWKKITDKFYTEVLQNEQIDIQYNNGINLKTSKKHPLLVLKEKEYGYENYNSGLLDKTFNKTISGKSYKHILNNYDEIGWWIGCHMGDGSARLTIPKQYGYYAGVFSIIGNNKEIIEKYRSIFSKMINNENISLVTKVKRKSYKSECWEFRVSSIDGVYIIDNFLDNQINKKTYTWSVPNFINKNNLWIPFLAGLIDSDGHIRKEGKIDIDITSKNAIDDISFYLSSIGQRYSVNIRYPKKNNENNLYRLHIYKDSDIYTEIMNYVIHPDKLNRMKERSYRHQSGKIKLLNEEIELINNVKISSLGLNKREYNLFKANRINLNKERSCGKAALYLFNKIGLINNSKLFEILSRTQVKSIIEDNNIKYKYIDIVVEDNNNYYCGSNFGFVNIHNCGIDISNLRPNNAAVNNSAKISSGPVDWMQIYDVIGKIIGQSSRKMAMMISMDINHPDILDFIKCKQNTNAITNANISIKFNDEFMQALENDEDYILRFPCDLKIDEEVLKYNIEHIKKDYFLYNHLYNLVNIDGTHKGYIKMVKAKEIWDEFVYSNRNHAEPGFLNWDRMINYDPTSIYKELKAVSTNPCGELSLAPKDSCRLMATNLYSMVSSPFTENSSIDKDLMKEIFYEIQVMTDLIVDLEIEAVDRILLLLSKSSKSKKLEIKLWEEIKNIGSLGRRTGTGYTALGDMFAALNKPYGDFDILQKVMKLKLENELDASIDLAILKGTFPLWDKNKEFHEVSDSENTYIDLIGNNEWYQFIIDEFPSQTIRMLKYGRRNSGISTLAPTGTVSVMTQTTSGIEPLFLPFYVRRRVLTPGETADYIDENGKGFKEFVVVHPKLKEYFLASRGLNEYNGWENTDWQRVYEESPYYKQTANDINWVERVKIQGLIQEFITSSISSTINLPQNVTIKEVDEIYKNVFKYNLKGCTIYREGSRSGVLVATDKKNDDPCKDFATHNAPKRPKTLTSDFYKIKYKGQNYIIIIGLYCEMPYELFCFIPTLENIELKTSFNKIKEHRGTITKIKKNLYKFDSEFITIPNLTEFNSEEEKRHCTRTSLELRHGIGLEYIIKTFKKYDDSITSFSSVCARILNRYLEKKEGNINETCPECGLTNSIIYENGCKKCTNCGWSACS